MRTNRGLVKMVILIVIALILLAYLGLNLREITSSPTFIDNWEFIKNLCSNVWNNYLKVPFTFIWSKVFIPFVWEPIVQNISNRQ
jgi:ABC-type phosphate/phosphonate transport system permease subunit